ncbi:arginine and glutamate-rich protein 1-A-like [Ambystoma mexicanum]|uniref:arginine and glutamate-rich protein 1-A-like n=1 Tax=Ambystoma mexicanum TaxID=8296 RepID=UPI0037E91AC1
MKETEKERERMRSRTPEKRTLRHQDKEHRSNYPKQKEGDYDKSRGRPEPRREEQKQKRKNYRSETSLRPRTKSRNPRNKNYAHNRSSSPRDRGEMSFRYRSITQKYNQKVKKVDKAKWRIKLTQVKENRDEIILNHNSVLRLFKFVRKLKHIKSDDLLVVDPSHVDTKAKTVLYLTSTTLKNLILDCRKELEEMGYEVQSATSTEDNKQEVVSKECHKYSEKQIAKHQKHTTTTNVTQKNYTNNKERTRTLEPEKKLGEKKLALTEDKYKEIVTKTKEIKKTNRIAISPQKIDQMHTTVNDLQKRCEPMKGIWSWLPKALREKKQL